MFEAVCAMRRKVWWWLREGTGNSDIDARVVRETPDEVEFICCAVVAWQYGSVHVSMRLGY